MKLSQRLASITLIVILSGCTNSPTVLKVLYGQFDNFMARELLSYASFTEAQETQIRAAVDQTVSWHRQQALPDYIEVITETQQRLLNQSPTISDIEWMYSTMIRLAEDFEEQSPLLNILPVITQLDDDQVSEVEEKINQEFTEELEEMEKDADKDLAELSTKNMSKFFKRLGLKLNKTQKAQATRAFRQRQVSEAERMVVWRQWADQFLRILQQRKQATFADTFKQHYESRFTLIERSFPERWAHDQALGKTMMLELFQSLDEKQKTSMRVRLESLSNVAKDLAAG